MRPLAEGIEVRAQEELYINIQPIQAAGRLTPEGMKALLSYADGYSVCDDCLAPFRLDRIKRPDLERFHSELASFMGVDVARTVPGARRGFQAACSTLVRRGDPVVLTAAGHYSEFLAVEAAGGVPREVPLDAGGRVTGEAVEATLASVEREFGRPAALAMVDHVDYQLGNLHDAEGAARACRAHNVPILLNGAYTVGVMPVDARALGVDILVGSGHKSMACPAPSGVVGACGEVAQRLFRTTSVETDLTKRRFGIKEVEMLGCTLMGANIVVMMATLPAIRRRIASWESELERANHFCREFGRIEGNRIISEMPRRHCVTKVDTTQTFDRVAREHKRKGYFLTRALKDRGIVGVFPGATRTWKMSTYGLTWDQVRHLEDAFLDIARANGLGVN